MDSNRFEKFRKHWIWAIIAFIVSTIITGCALFLQYRSTKHDFGGSLNATFHSRLLNSRDARTIIVCLEDTTLDLNDLYVTPTFDNPSEFSLKDFSLSFDAECTNVVLVPTTFVDAHDYGGKEWIFKYKEDVLAAHDDTKKPFSQFRLSDTKGRCYIKTKASYDGAPAAFEYNTDVWFFVVPNMRNLSFEDWKINCKKRIFESISDKYYDVYYYAKNHRPEYQFDVALVTDNQMKNPVASTKEDASKTQNSQKISTSIANTSRTKREKDAKDNSKVTETKNTRPIKDDTQKHYYEISECLKQMDGNRCYLTLTFKSTDGIPGLYMIEYKYKAESEQFQHYTTNIPAGQKSNHISITSPSEDINDILDISLYPQSQNEEVISVEQKDGEYIIRNITDCDIVCYINYSENSSTIIELRGGEERVVENIGSFPIDVFKTDRKTKVPDNNPLQNNILNNVGGWVLLILFMILMLMMVFGLMYNFYSCVYFINDYIKSKDFKHAWAESFGTFMDDDGNDNWFERLWYYLTKYSMIFCIPIVIWLTIWLWNK